MDTAAQPTEEQQYIGTIKVEGLFGKFDHTVELKEGGLTILYGENGVGKTTLFKLIYYGLEYCRYGGDPIEESYLRMIPFDKIIILNQHGNVMYHIWKEANEKHKYLQNLLYSEYYKEGYKKVDVEIFHLLTDFFPRELSEFYSRSRSRHLIINRKTKGRLSYKDFAKKYKHVGNDILFEENLKNHPIPHFIPSSRIQDNSEINVTSIAKSFLNIVSDAENAFETKIRELSSSQNRRIFENQVSTDVEDAKLQEKLQELQLKIQQLQQVGLLYQQETPITSISDKLTKVAKAIVAINTNDYLEALTAFDDLYPKLVLLLDIINNRRFSHKKIYINKIEGLTVRNDEGKLLSLENLSSGEQHELVLIYNLLFRHSKNKRKKLFLIDEPEISLHLLWQQDFVKDMQEIIKLTGIQIITATHAPGIINGNWDLTVNLKYPEPKAHSASEEKEEEDA
jgi:predicted ATPase